jgi:hypothetical protein
VTVGIDIQTIMQRATGTLASPDKRDRSTSHKIIWRGALNAPASTDEATQMISENSDRRYPRPSADPSRAPEAGCVSAMPSPSL